MAIQLLTVLPYSGAGRSRNVLPVEARSSTPAQACPRFHRSLYTVGTGCFPGIKLPRRDLDHPPQSSSQVEERIELYRFSPFRAFMAGYRVNFILTFSVTNLLQGMFEGWKACMERCVASSGNQFEGDNVYLLTPWCRVLLEKLPGLQLVKKFPAFHGNRRFITALTSVRHLSLSRASPIQSIYTHPTSWRSILILYTHQRLGLPIGLFPSRFPTKTLYTPLSSLIRAIFPAHLILLHFITRTILGEQYKSFSSSLCNEKETYRTHVRLDYPSDLIPSGFSNKTLYTLPSSPICATMYKLHFILIFISSLTENRLSPL